MMKKLIKLMAFLMGLLLMLPSLVQARMLQGMDQSFAAVKAVDIILTSSDCRIRTMAGNKIRVKNENNLESDNYTPIAEIKNGILVIREKFRGWASGSSRWIITLPPETEVSFKSASGDLDVRGLKKGMSVRSASGDISIEEMKGRTEIVTASGDMELENITGVLTVSSASGDIDARLLQNEVKIRTASGDISLNRVKGKISIKSASGEIEINDVTAEGNISAASGEIALQELKMSGPLTLRCASGDVEVKLAQTAAYDLSLSAASGSVTLDFNGHAMKGSFELTAGYNRGDIDYDAKKAVQEIIYKHGKKYNRVTFEKEGKTPVIKLSTHSGDIELKK